MSITTRACPRLLTPATTCYRVRKLFMATNTNQTEKLIRALLVELGEDPDREGLKKTPERVARMYADLTSGYTQSLKTLVNDAIFAEKVHNMIILKDIELYSLCEHHLLPFFGKCHIAYIAGDKVVGISKLARIVDMFAKRLQLQERLTQDIAESLQSTLSPLGVGVVIEAQHLCMMMRGVQKQNSIMVTSAVHGVIKDDPKTREEFLSLVIRK
jgi:GTP cyclohydrolase IA